MFGSSVTLVKKKAAVKLKCFMKSDFLHVAFTVFFYCLTVPVHTRRAAVESAGHSRPSSVPCAQCKGTARSE